MLLSVILPIHNERGNLETTIRELTACLDEHQIPFEILMVDDCSTDDSWSLMEQLNTEDQRRRKIRRSAPPGFGRAIRTGLEEARGEVLTIVMADASDRPADVVAYYRKIQEGYDCVYGSRFLDGSVVESYPPFKLFVNRLVNRALQVLFLTRHNDLTNAFKMYRRDVIENCGPYQSCHFNITLELSLSALIRRYDIASIPIHWYGRTCGSSKLSLMKMGRKYLAIIVKIFCERLLISDDLMAEKVKNRSHPPSRIEQLERRIEALEEAVRIKSGNFN